MRKISFLFLCLCLPVFAQHARRAESSDAAKAAGESLARLRRGNEIYLAGKFDATRAGASRRAEVSAAQHPFATILSCADSRVPPELIFNQGLGDLFVVRVAGAVADQAVLGSVEYAAEHLNVPLVVVMGHSSCGAVKAAMDSAPPAKPDPAGVNLERILSAIRPSLAHLPPQGDKWAAAVHASVARNVADLIRLSPVLAEMREAGKLTIVSAFYDLKTGKVELSEPAAAHKEHH